MIIVHRSTVIVIEYRSRRASASVARCRFGVEQPSIVDRSDFINPVAKEQPAVKYRDGRSPVDEGAVEPAGAWETGW
jgi:hypothetical protein